MNSEKIKKHFTALFKKKISKEKRSPEGKGISDLKKQNKSLIAAIIVLAGVAMGSFFVDIVQLFSQRGFSAKALKDAQVVEYEGYTWVRYDDPKVVVEVFDADDCEDCVTDDVLVRLRSLIPTIQAHRIDVRSEEGALYAAQNGINYIPSFLFEKTIVDSDFYQQAAILFKENINEKRFFDASSVGVPIGEYLRVPDMENAVILDDNMQAPVKIVLYDNPITEESNTTYPILEKIRNEEGENIHFGIKIVPDETQEKSVHVARAFHCAQEQGMYDEVVKIFYNNHKSFIDVENIQELFDKYLQRISIDLAQYNTCMQSEKIHDVIDESSLDATKFGVIASPTLFINGQPYIGIMTYQGLKDHITAIVEEHDTSSSDQ
jgi:protein-disulfide isomerase